MKNINKTTKTILFATLAIVMVGSILPAFAQEESETNQIPKATIIDLTVSDEKQELIDKVAAIGEKLSKTTKAAEITKLQKELNVLKPQMLTHGLTPTFAFGEDLTSWEEQIRSSVPAEFTIDSESDWHVKHEIQWGCNPFTYCTEIWSEYIDLNEWSNIQWTAPKVHQSYTQIKHLVANLSGSTQTATMNGYGTHTDPPKTEQQNKHKSTQFWMLNEVESDIVLVTWNTEKGDIFSSTIRITK